MVEDRKARKQGRKRKQGKTKYPLCGNAPTPEVVITNWFMRAVLFTWFHLILVMIV
jgi:hypothetical protein